MEVGSKEERGEETHGAGVERGRDGGYKDSLHAESRARRHSKAESVNCHKTKKGRPAVVLRDRVISRPDTRNADGRPERFVYNSRSDDPRRAQGHTRTPTCTYAHINRW